MEAGRLTETESCLLELQRTQRTHLKQQQSHVEGQAASTDDAFLQDVANVERHLAIVRAKLRDMQARTAGAHAAHGGDRSGSVPGATHAGVGGVGNAAGGGSGPGV